MKTNLDTRRWRFAPLSCLALAILFAPLEVAGSPKTAPPLVPPEFEENWYVVMLQGQPCGFMHGTMRTVGDEVHTDTITQIEIKRGPATVKMRMEQRSRETLDGKPLGFKNVQTLGAVPQTVEGRVRGDKIVLTTSQFKTSSDTEYDFDPDCRFSWGLALESRKHGLAPGTTYSLKTYEPSLKKDGPIEVGFLIHGLETVDVLGKSMSLHRMTSSLKIEPAEGAAALPGGMTIDSDIWVDDDMTPIIVTVDLGIMKMKMFRTTKEKAQERGAPPEMFLQSIITANRDVSRDAKSTKYRVSIKDGVKALLPTFPDTDMQTFRRIDDRSGIVTVKRTDWDALRSADDVESKPPADIADRYLAASPVCDSNNRKIKRIAIRACKKDASPTEKANTLRRYITKYISQKGMDVGFATATEVALNKRGDCTEHAVLLAAVARAAGIPARGVGGLVGVPRAFRRDPDGAMDFGFHMWTQVHINGKWVDIDAAMRQTECDTTHIATTLIALGNEGMMSEMWSIIPLLGQIEIEILDVDE